MAFTIQQLLEGRKPPITIHATATAVQAIELMIEHDYSQLPVVDQLNRPLGMVTSNTILRAVVFFGVTPNEIRVADAIKRVPQFRADEDLFEVLDDLRDSYAVLIVDAQGRLDGIVTSFDANGYFRRRHQDIMFVEDIENTVKDFVLKAFTKSNGDIDESELSQAIEALRPSADVGLRKAFKQALISFLQLDGTPNAKPNQQYVNTAFVEHLAKPQPVPKRFDQLTLFEYIELLLHKDRWNFYCSALGLEASAIRKLLDSVRQIRNAVAHFRGDLTPLQREQLRFCKEWLSRVQFADTRKLPEAAGPAHEQDPTTEEPAVDLEGDADLLASAQPSGSRYAPLAVYLQTTTNGRNSLRIGFDDIERIIRADLPDSARKHRAWWSNDPDHAQSAAWIDAGWRVETVDMVDQAVTFAPMRDREAAYTAFFSALLSQLRAKKAFVVVDMPPSVMGWLTVTNLPPGRNAVARLGMSFVQRPARVWVGLYIGNSRALFDSLASQWETIEAELGETLVWEREVGKLASRVALYRPGSIADEPAGLEELRAWAADALVRLYQVLAPRVEAYLAKNSEASE